MWQSIGIRRYSPVIGDWLRVTRVKYQFLFLQLIIGYVLAGGRDVLYLAGALMILAPCLYGGLYAINEVRDVAADRLHPHKSMRPVAAGRISPRRAAWLGLSLIGVALGAAFAFDPKVLVLGVIFLVLNLAYTLWLKHVPYVEIILNTVTHPLRFAAGLWLAGDWTYWPLLVTWFPAVFAICTFKRLKEMHEAPLAVRPVLRYYTETGLKRLIAANLGVVLGLWVSAAGWIFVLSGVWFVLAVTVVGGYFRVSKLKRLLEEAFR